MEEQADSGVREASIVMEETEKAEIETLNPSRQGKNARRRAKNRYVKAKDRPDKQVCPTGGSRECGGPLRQAGPGRQLGAGVAGESGSRFGKRARGGS